MEIKKIVVGTDFSELADQAIRQAMHLAHHLGAELVLVHAGTVAERDELKPKFGTYDAEVHRWAESAFREARSKLEEIREALTGQGVEVSQVILQGSPADAICQAAEDLHADLVVVGSHGKTGIRRLLLGSVAEKVIRGCPRPVLVGRSSAGAGGFRHVLVPVDFSESSGPSLEVALAVAARGAEVHLVHCQHLPHGLAESWGPGEPKAVVDIREAMIEQGNEKLNSLLLSHRAEGIAVDFAQIEAQPQEGILRELDAKDYDLVVVGSHGRRGLERWLVGSVAEAVSRHAAASVLIVK